MSRQLELLDTLVAEGRDEFTFEDARAVLGVSPTAAANTLRRLRDKGLVEMVARGHYAVRPFGSLGTPAATESLSLAVGLTFEGRNHRIAYLSALGELGLLIHPVRTIYVACVQPVRYRTISQRPLRVVVEKPKTIHLEAVRVGRSWQSNVSRALFDGALRIDLVGGVERLTEALVAGAADADPLRIHRVAKAFGARGFAAERRLASLAAALSLPLSFDATVTMRKPVIRLDSRDHRVEWVDDKYRVAWNVTIDELQGVVGN